MAITPSIAGTIKDIRGRSYDRPHSLSYHFPAASLTTAAVIGTVSGQKGATGRVRSVTAAIATTADANTAVRVGTSGSAALFANLPVLTTDTVVANGFTASTGDSNLIPADSQVEVSVDGVPTAGAADVTVEIDWF